MKKEHVPRHRLERLAAAADGSLADAAARAHVAGCDLCAVRKRAFDRAREHYLAAHPAAAFALAVQARAQQPDAPPRGLRRLLAWFRRG